MSWRRRASGSQHPRLWIQDATSSSGDPGRARPQSRSRAIGGPAARETITLPVWQIAVDERPCEGAPGEERDAEVAQILDDPSRRPDADAVDGQPLLPSRGLERLDRARSHCVQLLLGS